MLCMDGSQRARCEPARTLLLPAPLAQQQCQACQHMGMTSACNSLGVSSATAPFTATSLQPELCCCTNIDHPNAYLVTRHSTCSSMCDDSDKYHTSYSRRQVVTAHAWSRQRHLHWLAGIQTDSNLHASRFRGAGLLCSSVLPGENSVLGPAALCSC